MRGGVSAQGKSGPRGGPSSPRAWGCFYIGVERGVFQWVFPTCVGVFLEDIWTSPQSQGLPHVRGGVSFILPSVSVALPSSPRAWGCFHIANLLTPPVPVFPTCVGVFPRGEASFKTSRGLPHVRGGVSRRPDIHTLQGSSSPRAWGCFFFPVHCHGELVVFPTCVGVFLSSPCALAMSTGLPHVRGGVSALPRRMSFFP